MAENIIKVRQKQRCDTEANWTSKNPVLLAGEIAISSDKNGLMKVGDGKSLWTAIPYSKASLSKTDVTTALGYTPPTTNTTYSIGTSSTAGIVKLYTGTGSNTDGSMTQAAIKSALDGKSGTDHKHDLSTMINTLSTGTAVPTDADYFVSQYVGGGTTTTTYHRRPVSALWSYIKAKTDGLYQTKGSYAAASHKHGNADITNIDASKISSGTIDLARLPQGALERCVIVADETARLKLTTATVQRGDTVKVTATNKMYFVVDDTKLTSEAGYEVYTAGTATSVPWSGITGKPSSMPASDVYAWAKAANKPTYTKSEVGLGNVDNTADKNKSVKSAATWTTARTLSLTGSVTGSASIDGSNNVTISTTTNHNHAYSSLTGLPSLGNASTKTVRSLSSAGSSGWKDVTTDDKYVPTMSFIAYWNGAYSESSSNLAYCNKGAFGTIVTKNVGDYAVAGHTHSYLPLSGGTVTGVTAFTNTTASTSKTTGAVKVSGGVGIAGRMSANEVMIGDGATLKYDSSNKCINFVFA